MMTSSRRFSLTAAFQREQCLRIAAHLEQNIEKFERLAVYLDSEIRAEEERTQIFDATNVAYSTLAKAARARRDNLRRSSDELGLHLHSMREALDEVPEKQSAA
jgi:flagellar protein FliJ